MKPKTIITDFSNVYYDFAQLIGNEVIDCSSIDGTNCFLDSDAQVRLQEILMPLRSDGGVSSAPSLHWLDSGDYHYMSKLWMEGIEVPFTLVLMDHHPDMQLPQFGDMLSCGSWVRATRMSNPNLQRVVMFGVADELKEEASESYVTFVSESRLKGMSPFDIEKLISTIDFDDSIYISIDKDVMSEKFAKTNWDQGSMTLLQVEAVAEAVSEDRRILGVDFCGERAESKGGVEADFMLNLRTNLELQSFFEKRLDSGR